MANILSGKDWIPKWEAKVVMAMVTKAKTLKSNKAPISYVLRGASIVMRRWSDNLHLLGQSKQRWQARNLECAANLLRSVDSRIDIRTPSQKLQSQQRKTESPKTGREEKTRKMAREAKIITRPSLPAPVPSKPNLSHLHITSAAFPYRCPAQCSEVKPVTEWARMTDWVVAVITRSPGKVEEDKRWEVAKAQVGRKDRLG